MNFIDIHCHILPGIDDGPADVSESIEMVNIAAEDGISHIFATPHIRDGIYNNRPDTIINAIKNLRQRISDKIKVLHGADVHVRPDLIKELERGNILTLNGSGYLLIELPTYSIPPHLENLLFNLIHRKITPIITHPERQALLMNDLRMLSELRDSGAMIQVTAKSITGGFGREIQKITLKMIKKEMVDFVATDAHNVTSRPPLLSDAYNEVKKRFGSSAADRLFLLNPQKILLAATND
ncbi:MAG: tyrosine protein phosphatase [Nitrospirae bacterium]|nr:tyrosine protein phosphatase [Nitrospirota bacterium]